MVPFHDLPIDAPPGSYHAPRSNTAPTVGIQTYVFEMLEVIFLVADPMPTNDLFCAKLIVDIERNQ
jgi:hypothetical protein